MPHFTLSISAGGPVVVAFVGVSLPRGTALQAAGQAVPTAVRIQALVDTGASCTCVDPTIFGALGLTPRGQVSVSTPSTGAVPHTADQYDVSLMIPGSTAQHAPHIIPALPVVASELAPQGIQALIGRDILQGCVLVYNGELGFFTLAF